MQDRWPQSVLEAKKKKKPQSVTFCSIVLETL